MTNHWQMLFSVKVELCYVCPLSPVLFFLTQSSGRLYSVWLGWPFYRRYRPTKRWSSACSCLQAFSSQKMVGRTEPFQREGMKVLSFFFVFKSKNHSSWQSSYSVQMVTCKTRRGTKEGKRCGKFTVLIWSRFGSNLQASQGTWDRKCNIIAPVSVCF